MPLSLSDSEMSILIDAARPLHDPRERSAFLREVVAELAKYPEIGPGITGRVCWKMQRRYFDPPQFHNHGSKWNR